MNILRLILMFLILDCFAVNSTTIQKKVLFGYQGWFGCPGKWGGNWRHWAGGVPTPDNLSVEMYPDLSEFVQEDLCPAYNFTISGKSANLFSSENRAIVLKHFEWMRTYGLDGVLAQRFVGEIKWKRENGDIVLKNIRAGAEQYDRVFMVEWDISGQANYAETIKSDWMYMVDSLKISASKSYLHHEGKPVISIWGPGLNSTSHLPVDPAEALRLVQWFQKDAPSKYQAIYMGGTPAGFRTLNRDARTDSGWHAVYKAMDVVQPWNVGRYGDLNSVDGWWKTSVIEDNHWVKATNNLYMPVIFPGFSWFNLNDGPKNQIPRLAGKFLWEQAYQVISADVPIIKIAMFDEVDEGTAMFKIAENKNKIPAEGYWLPLDADGTALPSDWYLRVAGCITSTFQGKTKLAQAIPIQPTGTWKDSTSCWDGVSILDKRDTPMLSVHHVWSENKSVYVNSVSGKNALNFTLPAQTSISTYLQKQPKLYDGVYQVSISDMGGVRSVNLVMVIRP